MANELDDLRADIAELVSELGTDWTFIEESRTGDETTGDVTIGTPTEHVTLASPPLDPNSAVIGTKQYDDGVTSAKGFSIIYLPALKADGVTAQDFIPDLAMRCKLGILEYDIMMITEFRPSNLIAAWELLLSKRV